MTIITQGHHPQFHGTLLPFLPSEIIVGITVCLLQIFVIRVLLATPAPSQQLEFQGILLIYLEVPFYSKGKSHVVDLTSIQVSDPILTPS